MIVASKYYEAERPSPEGLPSVKSVGLRLESDDGWRYEKIVAIQSGAEEHERAQLERAVTSLIESEGRQGEWRWA